MLSVKKLYTNMEPEASKQSKNAHVCQLLKLSACHDRTGTQPVSDKDFVSLHSQRQHAYECPHHRRPQHTNLLC